MSEDLKELREKEMKILEEKSLKSEGKSNAKILKWKKYLTSSRNSKINMAEMIGEGRP